MLPTQESRETAMRASTFITGWVVAALLFLIVIAVAVIDEEDGDCLNANRSDCALASLR